MTEPSDHTRPGRRTVLEPTHVMRRRRPRALSDFTELFRPEDTDPESREDGRGEGWEHVPLDAKSARPPGPPGPSGASGQSGTSGPSRGPRGGRAASNSQDSEDTEELPPVPAQAGAGGWTAGVVRPRNARFTALLSVAAAGVVGFGIALLLTWGGSGGTSEAAEPPPAPAPTTEPPGNPTPAPTGPPAGTTPPAAPADPGATAPVLQEGDSGPEVTELQERLLRIPNVYEGGDVTGTYDTTLTEAVGRFQLWYGIRGDETGVYGDDTRRDLESRTGP
ncbi:peptidoglycan-binding protein [Streptomyces sp. NPDC059255]|uniref:peptidoglycan-binding domain-containing protein n=1 Tax=Streptomyces sp. NPDC059255 TaxID=3346793 RepID=UPI0036797709